MDPPPRCFVIVLFLLFLGGSIALFGVSVWVLIKYEAVQNLVASTPTLLEDSAFCGITAGIVAFLTAIWGACGIRRNNKFILSVSVAGLFMTACIEFVVLIMAFLFVGQFDQQYGSIATASLKRHYRCTTAAAATVTSAWDDLQTTNHCCGFFNGTDYVESFYDLTTSHLQPWPFSCCLTSESGTIVNMATCLDSENTSYTHANTVT
uniref:Tetraspanin-18-like n=1 Tax=Phallusia mammillata TaxID=59560 RepID=A0A6F9DV48_9ASCI|nr:tetraspanin-18-like [Phallusia mammillata]